MTHTIGVVGTGGIAETMHLPVLTAMPGARVAWVTDLDETRARAVARAFGVDAVKLPADPGELPPCDAALLAIPPGVRMPYFRAFAARGTAVMAEKPFALSSEEHRAIGELFAPHRIACGYQRRNYGATRLVRELLSERWFGAPVVIRIGEGDRVTQSGTDVSHLDDVRSAGGGVLISQGCHSIDWLLFVTKAEGYEVADVDFVFDGELDRKFSARMRLDGECGPVDVDCCVSWLDVQPNRIEILFENADLSLGVGPDASLGVRSRKSGALLAELAARLPGMATTMNQAFYLEWSQFLDGLEREEPSMMSAAASYATTALIEELYRKGRAS